MRGKVAPGKNEGDSINSLLRSWAVTARVIGMVWGAEAAQQLRPLSTNHRLGGLLSVHVVIQQHAGERGGGS